MSLALEHPAASRPRGVALLLLLGVGLWLLFGNPNPSGAPLTQKLLPFEMAAAAAAILSLRRIREPFAVLLARARGMSPRAANRAAAGVGLLAAALLYLEAAHQHRPFAPTIPDEHMHLLQMQMLARGRLWMPEHPLADFFEVFHVFVKPIYAAMYFPGTAMLFVPAVWLNLPTWLLPLVLAGAIAGLFCRLLTALLDGVAGILGALILLASPLFRYVSITVLSYPVLMLWGLLGLGLWLMWRRQRSGRWAFALGIVLGWAAITRPLDGLCLAAPIGLAILWELRLQPAGRWMAALVPLGAGMLPLLALQLVEDRALTGRWLVLPYAAYCDLNFPGLKLGFPAFDPAWKCASHLLQVQSYYSYWCVPLIREHRLANVLPTLFQVRLKTLTQVGLNHSFLVVLFPAGLLALKNWRRRIAWLFLPLSVGAYCAFPCFLPPYALLSAPAMILTVLMGMRTVEETFPRLQLSAILPVVVACLALSSLPPFKSTVKDQPFESVDLPAMRRVLASDVKPPAVVLFPFRAGDNWNEELAYNIDVAWPDDAPIIHAQDLGPVRDQEIARYYGRIQPDRNFYIYDRRTQIAHPMGKAGDFLAELTKETAGAPSP